MPGATVTVRGTGRTVQSDGRGSLEIRGLEPGPAILEVEALGYEPAVARVQVENGRRAWVEITLVPRAVPVPGVVARGTPGQGRGPGGVVVLDREAIRRTGGGSLGEVLEGLPGVTVRSRGPGGPETVSIRGSGSDGVLVLVDGAPLNDPVTGEADLSSVQAGSLEEVKVLPGARSARFGPRAEGGVVVVRSRGPREETGASIHGGSLGLVRGTGDLGIGVGSLQVGGGADLRSRDGGFSYQRPLEVGGGTDERGNADLTQTTVRLGARGRLGGGGFDLRLSRESLDRGLPGEAFAPSDSARQALERYRGAVSWGADGERGSVRLSGYGVWQSLESRDPAPPRGRPYADRSEVAGLGFRGEATRPLEGTPLSLVGLGVDVDHQEVRADALEGEGPTSHTDGGLWLRGEVGAGPDRWDARLAATVRIDRDDRAGRWRPTHDVTVSMEPGLLTLHASHRSAFSPPTLGDQFFREGVGVRPNPELRAERVPGEVEVGVSGQGSPGPLRLAGAVTAYRGDVRDMIVWAPDFRFVWSPRNVDVKRGGGEVWLRLFEPASGTSLSASISRDRVVYDRPGRDTVQVRYRPRHGADLRLGWEGDRTRLTLGARYLGTRYPVPAPVNGLSPFWTVDLAAEHSWRWSDWAVGVDLRVDRLLDRKDSFIFAFPEPGRTIEVGVRLEPTGGSS